MGRKKKSVFYKLFVSYIIISAIPVLVMGGIFYYFNVINLQEEIKQTNLSNL